MTYTPRVKTALFVSGFLRYSNRNGVISVLRHRGDPDSGAVMIVLSDKNNLSIVLTQSHDDDGEIIWIKATGLHPVSEESAERLVERQRNYDPDLWVIECETVDFRPPFDLKIKE